MAMTRRSDRFWGMAAALLTALVLMVATATKGRAAAADDESKVQQGFAIAPVKLNLTGKNRALAGLGSYSVNASGDCNGCHFGPGGEFADGGNPFLGQPKVINEAAYLAGGTPLFGPVFIPRNLTPDKTGKPAGGAS